MKYQIFHSIYWEKGPTATEILVRWQLSYIWAQFFFVLFIFFSLFNCPFFTSYLLVDVDERSDHACDENANCTNTKGSHFCTCKEGYTGEGKSCQGTCLVRLALAPNIIIFHKPKLCLYILYSYISILYLYILLSMFSFRHWRMQWSSFH